MARIVSLDEVDPKMRSFLLSKLRCADEAVVLPQAHRSPESKVAKNVVYRLEGRGGSFSPEIFSPNWFSGVSVLELPQEKAEFLLSDPRRRQQALEKLTNCIESEMADSQVQVGPDLESDANDKDLRDWVAGFDSPGCCVGIYAAVQSKSPDPQLRGMNRAFKSYYLLVKAGAGVAAQTFHSRLTAAIKDGKILDEALGEGGCPGAQALRRVSSAGSRNRGRILAQAASAMGFFSVDTIGDTLSPIGKPYRAAVPLVDATYNSIVKLACCNSRSVYQYSCGAVDSAISSGLVSCSNATDGFVMFVGSNGDCKLSIKNDAHDCIPFSTERLISNRDAVFAAIESHKKGRGHPDHNFLQARFLWKSKRFSADDANLEPTSLWGSHESEDFVAHYARECGISAFTALRLQPELVNLAAVEPAKLRVAVKALK
jgi:hypothetical protein